MINNQVQLFLGRVESIGEGDEKGTTIIRFSIPFIIDNIKKFPLAYPIGNHSHKISKGDSVLITRVSSNDRFFYQPLDFSEFIGNKYDDNNYVEVKKDNVVVKSAKVVDIESAESVNIKGTTSVNIESGAFELKVANKTILTVTNTGTISINTDNTMYSFCVPNCFMTGALHGSNTNSGPLR